MSSAIEPYPINNKATRPTSPLGSMWGRLLWKDAREVVPVWITLLLAAILCLAVSVWMVNSSSAHIAPLYISAHTFIALISVITGVFLLANEDENRTLHLLRNLPLPPRQIVWQKLLLGAVGVIALACLIAVFTMILALLPECRKLDNGSTYGFTIANVVLLPLLYLVVALLSSMVSRSHFYGVLIAGAVSAGIIAVLEPSWLGTTESSLAGRGESRWLWVTLTVIVGIAALVWGANGWAEERVIAKPCLSGHSADATQTNNRSTAVSPNPFPVLLWQSFRQSWVLLACWIGLTIVGWIMIPILLKSPFGNSSPNQREMPFAIAVMTLQWTLGVMVLFASSIFLDDKRKSNFLFFQQNRERSKWFWLSRLLPFWLAACLLLLLWNTFIFVFAPDPFHAIFNEKKLPLRSVELLISIKEQVAYQSFFVPLLSMVGIIGIGQYFSIFVRNPILSFVFTGIISVVFVTLLSYMVFINENLLLYVVPTIAAGYSATWWWSKSWLATAPDRGRYFIALVAPVIVFAIFSVAFIHHRSTEFGDVPMDPNNFAQWNKDALLDQRSEPPNAWGLQRVEFGTEAQRQQAATFYRDAIELYDGNLLLMDRTAPVPSSAQETADFVSKNKPAIEKVVAASLLPVCAPFLSENSAMRIAEKDWLQRLALVNSRHQLLNSKLSAAKLSIDAYDRVSQRANASERNTRYRSGYYGLLVAWAEQPNQTLEALKSAIAILEGSDSDIRPTKIISANGKDITSDAPTSLNVSRFFRELGGERAFMDLQYEVASLQANDSNHRFARSFSPSNLAPWEYQRMLKVGQRLAIGEFDLQTIISQSHIRNDFLISYESVQGVVNEMPRSTPPDEDRMGFPLYSVPFHFAIDVLEEVTWRRYAMLRLGLAAYRREHQQLPDDLLQLTKYYQYGLPTTINGMMFAWFKDGLKDNLFESNNDLSGAEESEYFHKIADGKRPILLPFPLKPNFALPEPTDLGDGKQGITIESFRFYRPRYNRRTYNQLHWNIGDQVFE